MFAHLLTVGGGVAVGCGECRELLLAWRATLGNNLSNLSVERSISLIHLPRGGYLDNSTPLGLQLLLQEYWQIDLTYKAYTLRVLTGGGGQM